MGDHGVRDEDNVTFQESRAVSVQEALTWPDDTPLSIFIIGLPIPELPGIPWPETQPGEDWREKIRAHRVKLAERIERAMAPAVEVTRTRLARTGVKVLSVSTSHAGAVCEGTVKNLKEILLEFPEERISLDRTI